MYCKNCGVLIENANALICVNCGCKKGDGKNFCQNCGQRVKSEFQEACLSCGSGLHQINMQMKKKSKLVAALLAFFLGGFGLHRFYLGSNGAGIAILILTILGFFTFGITSIIAGVWCLIDFIRILCNSLTPVNGRY